MMRLLNYCKVDYSPRWILLPEEMKHLEVELKQLPILKYEDKALTAPSIISLCKDSALKNDISLIPEDNSLATRILFEWATTNLVGLYTGLLCNEPKIKERVFKDYLSIYDQISEPHLEKVSSTMLRLNSQTDDISVLSNLKVELALELLAGFDQHMNSNKFWLGDKVSICDFALFSFCYQLYNPQLVFFRDVIKKSENLYQWMKRIDQLSRSDFSKMKV